MVKLELSLKRVQTFIFEVPRLKAMLGANALIGQVLRYELPKLVHGRGCTLAWPQHLKCDASGDPLSTVQAEEDRDDPAALYAKGILARDGGHFIAVFPDEAAVRAFLSDAETMLAELLPGVLYEYRIEPFGTLPSGAGAPVRDGPREIHLLSLPVLQVCEETGKEPASERLHGKQSWAARSVIHRMKWGGLFYEGEGKTRDLIGVMRGLLYPTAMNWAEPADLEQVAGGGYLALIHADGNRVGQRYNLWKQQGSRLNAGGEPSERLLAQEAHGEAFFHSMRVTVRQAIVSALARTFTEPGGARPYEVLMLGGDDLLLVCRAERALELALNYARALQGPELADGKRLDVAIGIAIAKPSYPVHRLHELAEELAASAKRLYRTLPEEERNSVIDWQVVTQSWFAGTEEVRSSSERVEYTLRDDRQETLLLTGRPYRVLCGRSLEWLRDQARALDDLEDGTEAGRSPLRALRGACERGRLSGELAFARLPGGVRATLGEQLWGELPAREGQSPGKRETQYLTRALDIIGVREISRLGTQEPRNGGR